MTQKEQARILLHQRRIAERLTMKQLAKRVGAARESVSRAVNQGHNPRVLRRVKEVLGV